MLDKFLYKYFNQIDRAIAFVETYAIKVSECAGNQELIFYIIIGIKNENRYIRSIRS